MDLFLNNASIFKAFFPENCKKIGLSLKIQDCLSFIEFHRMKIRFHLNPTSFFWDFKKPAILKTLSLSILNCKEIQAWQVATFLKIWGHTEPRQNLFWRSGWTDKQQTNFWPLNFRLTEYVSAAPRNQIYGMVYALSRNTGWGWANLVKTKSLQTVSVYTH